MNRFQMEGNRFFYRAVWPLAVMATILYSSSTSGPEIPGAPLVPHFDKIAHFFVFGLIATLIYRALPAWVNRRRAAILAILFTSLFGFADELRQSFNPHRYMEFMDWVADTAGAIVAVSAYKLWPFYRNLLELPLNPFKKRRHGARHRSQTHRGIAPDNCPAR